jgi:hypothetical protein
MGGNVYRKVGQQSTGLIPDNNERQRRFLYFWDITPFRHGNSTDISKKRSPPSSESMNKLNKKPDGKLLLLIYCLTYSSTLKMEAKCSCET